MKKEKPMKGDKKGLSFLRINGQYKLEFREIANAGKPLGCPSNIVDKDLINS